MNSKEPGLIYHSLHGRNLRGCLPVAFVLSALLVAGILMVVQVRMPEPVRPKGEGRIYYRNDALIHFQIRRRSPLPLNVPVYADPARQESAAREKCDGRVDAGLVPAPPFDFLSTPPDSAILDEAALLALPPARYREEDPAPVPSADKREEVLP